MNRFALSVVVCALVALGMIPIVSATAVPLENAPSARLAQDSVTIVALDSLQFDPNEVTVSPGQVVVVVNEGFLQHDLVVDEWGIETGPLNQGEFTTFTVPDDAVPGTSVEFHCTVPGHAVAGQDGTFIVAAADGTMPDTPDVQEIEALDTLTFSPDQLEVYPGQEIRVTNSGAMQHALIVDAWGIETTILSDGEHATITVPGNAEVGSTVTFYCPMPGHQQSGMEGTFIVVAPPPTGEGTAIENLNATIEALEQKQTDLSATATAIATQQAEIDEQIVTLEIQRDALIDATAAAQQSPVPTLASPNQSIRPAPARPTPTPQG